MSTSVVFRGQFPTFRSASIRPIRLIRGPFQSGSGFAALVFSGTPLPGGVLNRRILSRLRLGRRGVGRHPVLGRVEPARGATYGDICAGGFMVYEMPGFGKRLILKNFQLTDVTEGTISLAK